MNQIFKTLLLTSFLSIVMIEGSAQIEDYEYRAQISNANIGWNYIDLNQRIFNESKNHLNDIRIYHKDPTTNKYTEQPYYLDIQSAKIETKTIDFKTINQTNNKDLYSYTFELSNKEAVNKIKLDFNNQNFDWNVHLEGSMDNSSWSTIAQKYRIVSMNNSDINFTYSEISFTESKFNFYKISFQSSEKPDLQKASLSKVIKTQPHLINFVTQRYKIEENEKLKTTNFSFSFKEATPVSQVIFKVKNENDYYRPVTIEGAIDSFKTEKGWKYKYRVLHQGIISSLNKNSYDFDSYILKKLKITVYNFDSQPLQYRGITLKCPNYRLITRLEEIQNHFFVYGNENSNKPAYDITYFKDKIPKKVNKLIVSEAEHFPNVSQDKAPLFKNKWWLWASMIVVILLLGTFTLKMLREDK